jgi:hypothetical protein
MTQARARKTMHMMYMQSNLCVIYSFFSKISLRMELKQEDHPPQKGIKEKDRI